MLSMFKWFKFGCFAVMCWGSLYEHTEHCITPLNYPGQYTYECTDKNETIPKYEFTRRNMCMSVTNCVFNM